MIKSIKIIIACILTWLLLNVSCQGQSFAAHKSAGHSKECKQNRKTLAEKVKRKVKYNAKRHNNEGFANRERRRKVKINSL